MVLIIADNDLLAYHGFAQSNAYAFKRRINSLFESKQRTNSSSNKQTFIGLIDVHLPLVMDEKSKLDFPYEAEEVDREKNKDIYDFLEGSNLDFARIGPKKYLLTKAYMSQAATVYNFPLRSDDIFVVTFPKSGTTWTQDLVWLLGNNLDYEKAKSIKLISRFPFLEMTAVIQRDIPKLVPKGETDVVNELTPMSISQVIEMPSPRFIKSHLPLSILPPSLLDTTKVVYVARDPRDVAVSYYHHFKLAKFMKADREFKTFWNYFITDNILWTPYFEHVLEAWEQRNHPNMLFLFYEDLSKDLPGCIRRAAQFLGKTVTDGQVDDLCQHLHFDNFKKNNAVNMADFQKHGVFRNGGSFIRNGKAGGWRSYFDEEMSEAANRWIAKNLLNTDMKFPQ